MIALTVKQPWADAITHGSKRIETRTWPPPTKHVGARILIHAGAAYDPMGRFVITDWDALDSWPDTRSAFIAIATLTGAHAETGGCCAPWGERNVYHWALDDIAALPHPVPCRGRLGLWTPPGDALNAALAQAEGTR